MRDLSLHLLDIAQNCMTAKASKINISICADRERDLLEMEITDDGIGMDEGFLKKVVNPFVTARETRRVGLGIPLFEASAKRASGGLSVTSQKFVGTTVRAYFKISHIDRLPLGDIAQTLTTLITARPDIVYELVLTNKNQSFVFNSLEAKEKLVEVPITEPEVLTWICEYINEGVKTIFGGVLNEILS
ncbi:MAG: ATP-binding protein [Clostridium sp.]|jgi:hypothetical protein|nr:ATP-binding protein [Clostridium sp.]